MDSSNEDEPKVTEDLSSSKICDETNQKTTQIEEPDTTSTTDVIQSPEDGKPAKSDKTTSKEETKPKDGGGKSSMYKVLAVKLKKELVKTKDELEKLERSSENEIYELKQKVDKLDKSLVQERVAKETAQLSYSSLTNDLRNRLIATEKELDSLQQEYDSYKKNASELSKLNGSSNLIVKKSMSAFDADLFEELKATNRDQKQLIIELTKQLNDAKETNVSLQNANLSLNENLRKSRQESEILSDLNENLNQELENLNETIKQYQYQASISKQDTNGLPNSYDSSALPHTQMDYKNLTLKSTSSTDSMPTHELERTNLLLKDQVNALKDEIRRLERGKERLEIADKLEYLKNVVLKYITLDESQIEQRRSLIPVLKTVLKLSPEEVEKLYGSSTVQHSIFKLPLL